MDPDVAALVREERLGEAAELASARGDALLASRLHERACNWGRAAAREALRGGDPARALELAAEAEDDTIAGEALAKLAPEAAAAVAAKLAGRGQDRWAARALEALGDTAGRGAPVGARRARDARGRLARA